MTQRKGESFWPMLSTVLSYLASAWDSARETKGGIKITNRGAFHIRVPLLPTKTSSLTANSLSTWILSKGHDGGTMRNLSNA